MLSFVMIFVAVLAAVAGQLCLKQGMTRVGPLAVKGIQSLLPAAQRVLSEPVLLTGMAVYALAGVAWLIVLSRRDVSFAYPMLALTYAIIPAGAHFFLGESVPGLRWVGIGIVIIGVALIAQTGGTQ